MASPDYPVPANEEARQAALERYEIVDTPPEERFDRCARLAVRAYKTSFATVSFFDRDREFVKASVGGIEGGPRSQALGAHALMSDGVLVVPDARLDPRFTQNPAVVGEPRIRFYASAPLVTSDGLALGTLSVFDSTPRPEAHSADVSDLRDLAAVAMTELELGYRARRAEQAMLDLSRSNEALQQFAVMASHDLRAPTRQMVAWLDILEGQLSRRMEVPPDMQTTLDQLHASATRMWSQVGGVLEFASLATRELDRQPVSLAGCVEEALDSLAGAVDEHSAECWVSEDLPVVSGDERLLTLLLQNLLHNAIRYGGDHPRIRVTAKRVGDRWTVGVEDDGPGVPTNRRQEVFKLFTSFSDQRATGLGLAFCTRIAQLHDGRIDLDPGYTSGARFVVSFPV